MEVNEPELFEKAAAYRKAEGISDSTNKLSNKKQLKKRKD